MGIFDDVSTGMKEAMRARDTSRLAALRGIRAAFLTEMKNDNAKTLTDESCMGLLRKLEKQRKESIEGFEAGGRTDRADAERAELEVIQTFLPSLADEATTRTWVEEAIAASGASKPGDMGRVMGAVMKAHKGDVDGNLTRKLATELLAGE